MRRDWQERARQPTLVLLWRPLVAAKGYFSFARDSFNSNTLFLIFSLDASVHIVSFPHRSAFFTGDLIHDYLSANRAFDPETAHLIFSANRWEFFTDIANYDLLYGGDERILIFDRYFYSGAAYSSAKGLDIDWCLQWDRGLPTPLLVVLLDTRRVIDGDSNCEIYEQDDMFQTKAKLSFLYLLNKKFSTVNSLVLKKMLPPNEMVDLVVKHPALQGLEKLYADADTGGNVAKKIKKAITQADAEVDEVSVLGHSGQKTRRDQTPFKEPPFSFQKYTEPAAPRETAIDSRCTTTTTSPFESGSPLTPPQWTGFNFAIPKPFGPFGSGFNI